MRNTRIPFMFFLLFQFGHCLIFGSGLDPDVTNSTVFTFGNLQAVAASIKGGSTSGGNSTLVGTNTNDYYSQSNLMLMSTNILGNITLGGKLSISASRFGGLSQVSSSIYNFKSIQQSLTDTSNCIGQIAQNGTATLGPNDDLLLTGHDNSLNVFHISNPNYYASVQIDVPPKATAIINIMDEKPFLFHNSFNTYKRTSEDVDPSMVLYNFPKARSITINSGSFSGTLLAPLANTTISTSKITGGIITNTLVMKSTSIVGARFQGNINPPIHVPEPRTIIFAGISILTCVMIQTRSIEYNCQSG